MTPQSPSPDGDRIEVRLPAQGVYVATLRMCAASLAARCDLTVDDIEDLRLAVDEACALLLPHARTPEVVEAAFTLHRGELHATTSVYAERDAAIDRTGFAWTVLGALVDSVSVDGDDGRLAITITKRREAPLP